MNTRIRLGALVLLLVAVASPCSAQEKPPTAAQQAAQRDAELALPGTPATQPETVRQRLAKAIEVTKVLAPKGVTLERAAAEPALPPDRGPGGHIGRGDAEKLRFPQHRDVMPYLNSRPWAMSYIIEREVRQTIPPTVPSWPTAADAGALTGLLKDTDPAIRGLAIEALAVLDRPEDIPAIAELLAADKDALPALSPNMSYGEGFDLLTGGGVSFDKPVKPEDATTLKFSWHDRKVKDYAAAALYIMTGENLTADSFAAWWPDHKDARNCAWYWRNRLHRAGELAMLDAIRMEGARLKPWDRRAVRKAAMDAVLADLEKCPKETQAKVRLMCDPAYGIGVDLAPLANLISRERAFELLERKNLWPDLIWEFPDDYHLDNLRLLTDGVASQAVRLFRPEDAARLLAIRDRNLADKLYVGRASLTIAASRLMPPAGPDKLDDPATRDGLLRAVLAAEPKKDDEWFRAAVADELMNVALSANWKFLKAQFFRDTVVRTDRAPEPRGTILYRLGQAPLTAEKRAALIDLLTDNRCDALITGPGATGSGGLLRPAVNAVNWYAGKTLVPALLSSQLADPKAAAAALVEFRKGLAELKALPPPPPATQPGATGKS